MSTIFEARIGVIMVDTPATLIILCGSGRARHDLEHLLARSGVGVPDVDPERLTPYQQQRILLRESGRLQARPDTVIDFSQRGAYAELLELIKARGYDRTRRRGTLPDAATVAADWYDPRPFNVSRSRTGTASPRSGSGPVAVPTPSALSAS